MRRVRRVPPVLEWLVLDLTRAHATPDRADLDVDGEAQPVDVIEAGDGWWQRR